MDPLRPAPLEALATQLAVLGQHGDARGEEPWAATNRAGVDLNETLVSEEWKDALGLRGGELTEPETSSATEIWRAPRRRIWRRALRMTEERQPTRYTAW